MLDLLDVTQHVAEARDLALEPGADVVEPAGPCPGRSFRRRGLAGEMRSQELAVRVVLEPEPVELVRPDPTAVRGRLPALVAQRQLEDRLHPVGAVVLLQLQLAQQPGSRPQPPLERGHDRLGVRDPEVGRHESG
ncbi:MAG: hypothetical protein HOQ03_11570 [Thermoleophilia bacterium]|nr:hypothetical protein [Thermoleophilia bacterium]